MNDRRANACGGNLLFALLSLMVAGNTAEAGSAEDWARMKPIVPRGYVCFRPDSPLAIDGRLDEPAWQLAPWTDDFIDIEGDLRPRPKLRTRAKMLWNSDYFYIAVEIEEPHVWGTLTKHDAVIFQDNDFEFFIDPDGDNHEYYEFEMNALNTGWDLFLTRPYKDGGTAENRWDIPGLLTAVHIDGTLNDPSDTDKGWSIEIAVPWSALREYAHRSTPPQEGDQWRVDFSRVEWQHQVESGRYQKVPNTKEDNWVWSPQGIIDMHRPERWGYVQFSASPPGSKVAFKPDATLPARDLLMEIYHRQKSFHEKNKSWANSLDQLGLDPANLKGLSKSPVLKMTDTGFRATVEVPVAATAEVPLGNGATQSWSIRQDSRLRPARPEDDLTDAVEAVLTKQAGDWNRGDIDAFMEHYWKSDDLSFSSGGKTVRGWAATKERYKKRYATREQMGQLSFGAIEVTPLGESSALVLGRWNLQREPAPAGGNFSLVFRRIDGAWVIAHDHTSLQSEVVDESGQTSPKQTALERAGANRAQIEQALRDVPEDQRPGMQFLITNMPDRDLKSLSAEFLLENVHFAYTAWKQSPWKDDLPEEIFFNNVLPYANINEGRDRWRKDFYERFMPLIQEAKSPAQAAAILNQQIFPLLKVRYSTQRKKADQSPYESIKTGLASCTGLSVLLIDACRAVGVPARFVGTPLWTNKTGNHSWVEVWDQGWHFTGAAEPSGMDLDKAWFVGNASTAMRDTPQHAIFAVSFKRTPQKFPLVWDADIDYVHSVNVTDFYTRLAEKLPDGAIPVQFCAVEKSGGDRLAAFMKLKDDEGKVVFEGRTNDESFDANDHVRVPLQSGLEYSIELRSLDRLIIQKIKAEQRDRPYTFDLSMAQVSAPQRPSDNSDTAIESLKAFLSTERGKRGSLAKESFAERPLTRENAALAEKLLWDDHVKYIRESRQAEMAARELADGDLKLPFHYEVFGEKPKGGRSLYISMHGGGGAPKEVNDKQWENQKKLYRIEEGVYLAPRAATNTWDLWHQAHIDRFFSRLIENLIVFEDVDPDRVYLMGYSAGGDGVFQLAPRMADRFAAAAMMAGHPNETSPLGLRNLPFTIQMGGLDSAYNRNRIAREWEQKLDDLRKADPDGYVHLVKIYEDKGHWMDRLDASALPWMAQFRRNPYPTRIVWKQDDVKHTRFYWLAATLDAVQDRAEVTATRNGSQIEVQASGLDRLTIRVNDKLFDLDQPLTVSVQGQPVWNAKTSRTIAVLARTLEEYGDPRNVFSGELTIDIPRNGSNP